mgnify:CR=1 FL=1
MKPISLSGPNMTSAAWTISSPSATFICLAVDSRLLESDHGMDSPAAMQRFGYANMAEFYARDPSRLSLADVRISPGKFVLARDSQHHSFRRHLYSRGRAANTPSRRMAQRRSCAAFSKKTANTGAVPRTTSQAISEIERLRKSGCTHIIFAWPALWWLDYYEGFNQYLRSNFYCTLDNERLVAFDLRRPSDSSSCRKV